MFARSSLRSTTVLSPFICCGKLDIGTDWITFSEVHIITSSAVVTMTILYTMHLPATADSCSSNSLKSPLLAVGQGWPHDTVPLSVVGVAGSAVTFARLLNVSTSTKLNSVSTSMSMSLLAVYYTLPTMLSVKVSMVHASVRRGSTRPAGLRRSCARSTTCIRRDTYF